MIGNTAVPMDIVEQFMLIEKWNQVQESMSAGDFDTADTLAAGLPSHVPHVRRLRAQLAVMKGDPRLALSLLGDDENDDALFLRTFAQISLADFDAAWESYCVLKEISPDHPHLEALYLMGGQAANRSGRKFGTYDRTTEARMMERDPYNIASDDATEKYRAGDIAAGHSIMKLCANTINKPIQVIGRTVPSWDGGPVERLLILVIAGLGDAIHFARFIRHARQHAEHITLAAPPHLMRLLAECGADEVINERERYGAIQEMDAFVSCDWTLWAALGVLNYGPTTYLHAEPTLERSTALQVGLCWTSSPLGAIERAATLPDFDPLRTMRKVEWHSLVPGSGGDWMRIHRPSDFADTAGIVAGLDLVITVDTAVAHVAGAMGKRVWLLLPAYADWRWGTDEYSTPWYPSARLFRRRAGESWHGLMKRVRTMLEAKSQGLRDAKR